MKLFMRLTGIFVIFLSFISTVYAVEITVAAAANLEPVMDKLVTAFQTVSPSTVRVITGSSGKFLTQIENGAPFDVFMSADMKYPEFLYQKGLSLAAPKAYAYGVLVLWTVKPLDLTKGIAILQDPSIQKIAIASPKVAPYGREAINVMNYYALYDQSVDKLVFGENVSQANAFVVTGAADIGFTTKSTVLSGTAKEISHWIDVPMESYDPIAQGVVIISRVNGEMAAVAQDFVKFLFSAPARKIFNEGGYITHE